MRRSRHRASPSVPGASISRSSSSAPILLMGLLPEPHLGECTQEGQPSSQAQSALALLAEGMDSIAVKKQTGYSVGLYDINLSVKAGELHCIMGLSGSGKSTLIRHINRLIDPTSGKIWVDTAINAKESTEGTVSNSAVASEEQLPARNEKSSAINILALNDKELQHYRQQTVSMVFQHFGLVPHMTVLQNVAYGLRVRKMSTKERHEVASYWLNEVGLPNLERSYPD